MKINKTLTALIAGASLGLSGQAMAANTEAGQNIDNSVTLDYFVSGVAQSQENATSTFKVDNKIDMTLTRNTGVTGIVPGSTILYSFKLANDGNLDQLFTFDVDHVDNLDILGDGTKESSVVAAPTLITYYSAYTDSSTNTPFVPATGLTVPYDDDSAPNVNEQSFWVEVTYPLTQKNGDILGHTVVVTAVPNASNQAVSVVNKNGSDGGTPNLGKQLTVYADSASDNSDNAFNGTHTKAFGSEIATAFFTKADGTSGPGLTAIVVNDPLCNENNDNYGSNTFHNTGTTGVMTCNANGVIFVPPVGYSPKAIPGALVEYTITAKNHSTLVASAHTFFTHTVDSDEEGIDHVSITNGTTDVVEAGTYSYGPTTYTHYDSSTATVMRANLSSVAAEDTVTITFTTVIK